MEGSASQDSENGVVQANDSASSDLIRSFDKAKRDSPCSRIHSTRFLVEHGAFTEIPALPGGTGRHSAQ